MGEHRKSGKRSQTHQTPESDLGLGGANGPVTVALGQQVQKNRSTNFGARRVWISPAIGTPGRRRCVSASGTFQFSG